MTSIRSSWTRYPRLYEISTWVWLADLSRRHGTALDLSSVPEKEWDEIASYGFDAVWFMGVWERSPAGIAIANRNSGLLEEFRRALPDFRPQDNVGSPYCIRQYVVDQHLGGPAGLASARAALAKRGMRLVLDFVPNHVAPDHPWTHDHPEYFIQGSSADLQNNPAAYQAVEGSIFACGRDPFFPPWPDVLQLNAFDAGLRKAVAATLSSIAEQCDGVRCDMSMLFLNEIFARTWGERAGAQPTTEYWHDVISAVRTAHRDFLFIAEAYWDLEWVLQQNGFDFCYDKKLYDRLEHSNAEQIRLHLCADMSYQDRLLRFLENHDEPRSASMFREPKLKAGALMISTLPGMKLFYEGQFEGRLQRTPVFLGRRPDEPLNTQLQSFYKDLLRATDRPIFHIGTWRLCTRTGWPDNSSFLNFVAWTWSSSTERYLVVINLSEARSQALVQVQWDPALKGMCHLTDVLSGQAFDRQAEQMQSPGIYVELAPWDYHFLRFNGAAGNC